MMEGIRTQASRESSEAKDELRKLEETYAALKQVWHSLHFERQAKNRAQAALDTTKKETLTASDQLMSAHLSSEDAVLAQQNLENSKVKVSEAESWVNELSASPTVEYQEENRNELTEGPFADKLHELGVDVSAASRFNSNYNDVADAAISTRMRELEMEIMEKKTDIPGGTEVLVASAITKNNLFAPEKIPSYKNALSTHVHRNVKDIFKLYQENVHDYAPYPIVVQQGILRQMVQAGASEAMDTETLLQKLNECVVLTTEIENLRAENFGSEKIVSELREKIEEVHGHIDMLSNAEVMTDDATFQVNDDEYVHVLFGENNELRYRFLLPKSVAEKSKTLEQVSKEQLLFLLADEVMAIEGEIKPLTTKQEKQTALEQEFLRIGNAVVGQQ